jgi:hypothetical protein
MRQVSSEQLSAKYLRQWRRAKVMQIPSWWRALAPCKGVRFWNAVESMRKDSKVQKWDTSGMTYIIDLLRSSP